MNRHQPVITEQSPGVPGDAGRGRGESSPGTADEGTLMDGMAARPASGVAAVDRLSSGGSVAFQFRSFASASVAETGPGVSAGVLSIRELEP